MYTNLQKVTRPCSKPLHESEGLVHNQSYQIQFHYHVNRTLFLKRLEELRKWPVFI